MFNSVLVFFSLFSYEIFVIFDYQNVRVRFFETAPVALRKINSTLTPVESILNDFPKTNGVSGFMETIKVE